ncbi:ATP synthase F1, epsilon subunit [Limosilactobacillus coleohominis 101-4-CHN]|uniref:ATP synthase epsilon chain n=2 Tax=Limosilactobacillus coleohominis TaxID=181675 RepID=C7XWP3_9LACO|nr:ATP synthase F1, epsilon subunit [Limosilactobacillus coleohominis 101-4-CHN]
MIMADATFHVSIITPDGTVYDDDTTMLIVTTGTGEMGLMADHLPLIASLTIGELTVKHADTGDHDTFVAVNGGYVKFDGQHAEVIADSAELQKNIDVKRAQNAKARAEKSIQHAREVNDPDELSRGQVHLARAINRLRVSNEN